MLDYLIIGQGIAGTILAETLLSHQKTVLVINDEAGFCSSQVAAGIFNPLTGKKLLKTWLADTIFPFLEKFYTDLEVKLNTKFFHKKAIYRPFRSIEEQNEWLLRASLLEYEFYLDNNPDNKNNNYQNYIKNPFGGIATKQAGYVDLPTLLRVYKDFLMEEKSYINANFLYEDIVFEADKVIWKEFSAKKIIFCEGVNATENPFLKHLPFAPVKGEILEIKFSQDNNKNINNIINLGVSLVPIVTNSCQDNHKETTMKVASTYTWQPIDWEISAEATQELTEKAAQILSVPFEVVGQVAGVRPATKNRRPIVGLHHENILIGVFNGLGSKGVSLAPYLAHCFYEFLEKNISLPNEINGV